MDTIIEQLGLNQTFFWQLGALFVLFLVLSQFFFKPFLKLIEAREKALIEDKAKAEALIKTSQEQARQYEEKLMAAKKELRGDYEKMLSEAKKEEAEIISKAREESKKITQEVNASIAKQSEQLRGQLEGEVERLANKLSEELISRN